MSVAQGGAIMAMSLVLLSEEFMKIVAISFTALVINELVMVAIEISSWKPVMVASEVISIILYFLTVTVIKTDIGKSETLPSCRDFIRPRSICPQGRVILA